MITFDPILVQERLRQSARKFPQKTTLVSGNRRMSYTDVDQNSDKLTQGLRQISIRRHDKVVIFLDRPGETIVALSGLP